MILDEATSNLDLISEQKILNNISILRQDKTTIFITHRLASIKNFDTILVIKNGILVEKGSHDELIKKRGEYYNLYNKQLKEQKENV